MLTYLIFNFTFNLIFLKCLYTITKTSKGALAQWVGALAQQAEGWVLES